MSARFGHALAMRAAPFGAKAVAAASSDLAVRLATEAPEIDVVIGAGELRLSAPNLAARAFGSRRRGPDLRLQALAGGGR